MSEQTMIEDKGSDAQVERGTNYRSRDVRRGLGIAALLAAVLTGWEYLLQLWLNPGVSWSPSGVAGHFALDLLLLSVPAALAVFGTAASLRRRRPAAALSATVAALLFLVAALPVVSLRDIAHEEIGQRYGLSLAQIQTTVVRSDLTVQEATELCSFSSLANPGQARGYDGFAPTAADRLAAGGEALVIQLALLMPLLLALFAAADRRRRGLPLSPLAALSRLPAALPAGRSLRFALLGAAAVGALLCVGPATGPGGVGVGGLLGGPGTADAQPAAPFNACTDGGPVRSYEVSAINVTLTLNRWGDHVESGYMYALTGNVPAVRAFEAALEADRTEPEELGVTRVAHGLRQDPIQPLVLRANLGECLRIELTNDLDRTGPAAGEPVSMHILGLPHTVANAGGSVGFNPDTFAGQGETIVYEIPIPRDPSAERAYYLYSHGASRDQQNMGLFGAIVAEPEGAVYLDVETGEPLDSTTGSNWEAIIVDPNAAGRPDGKSFREFVIFYHEIGDEGFTDIRDRDDKKLPLVDEIAGVYRPAARALNYRSEPFRRRIEQDQLINGDSMKHGKSLGYSSYPFGDPATPIPRSYVGEGVKTRLLHGGSEVFHVHHLHGGGDRWRRNPDADPNSDFWKGLTKVPDPNLSSIHLDSQSIGPGTSYNLEHECGAGGCQQGVGDFLFHCHIGHHYIAGMWSFWRVFGTEQTAESNLYGKPLAVVPELYQNPSNPLIPPEPPRPGVSAGELIGLTVDGGRTIVADADFSDPAGQIALSEWLAGQLPPPGERFDNGDATVWNWTTTGGGGGLQVWGEPESAEPFAGYVSTTPGERPEVLFNPKNGRYTWPLFRPQVARRPPFTPRHTGAPWLGEQMVEGRLDGLCANNGVHPTVDVGNKVQRYYPVSAITLPIQVSADREDPDGQIFVLNEEEGAIRDGNKAAEPLTIRSNVGDCVEILLTNKIPDGPLNKNFSKVNIHSHFVQFDTQASDGVITGFSYEQSVRPLEAEDRSLTAPAAAGATVLSVSHTDGLRPGIWLGIGLGEGTCGTGADGQPLPCTEIRKIAALDATSITLDAPLANDHAGGEAVGVEFVRYNWYSDVDFGTVFFHTHVEFKDWDHGLFGTHIVEPKGSTYHDPTSGAEIRAGALADIRVDPAAGGNPVAHNTDGSFREFVLYLHNNSPTEGQFQLGGGTFNLRAEPWRLRDGESAYRFSSVTHGDPMTPLLRAYVGDPVVVRGMGLVERVGGVRFTGHRFAQERVNADSDRRDTTFIGISERFDVSLDGGAGGPGGYPGDYLYYSTLGRDFESGAWGLLRVHDTLQEVLQPLPDRPLPAGGAGFPQLTETGGAPPSLAGGPGDACPAGAPVREYAIVARDLAIIYNDQAAPDPFGSGFHLKGQPRAKTREPLVLRANAGECLRINLRNLRQDRSSLSIGELVFDPQRSYGAAVGYNYDSTVPPGLGRVFEYFADRELGIVIGLNLADVEAAAAGSYAGIVIEPSDAVYRRPGSAQPLPGGGAGVQADIVSGGAVTREMVALFADQDRRIGQNNMPYPEQVENSNGISYSAEPLRLRGRLQQPSEVFDSRRHGDPRHVVTVPAGTPLIYRVAQPWGDQPHVPTLEGHRWLLEPLMGGSEAVFNDVLVPGMSYNLRFVGGAGSDIAAPGDYLFLDRRQPFLEGGLWHILRVTADGSSGAADRVTVLDSAMLAARDGDGARLQLSGRLGIRPAGDTAPTVALHAGPATGGPATGGPATGGRCGGPLLGTAEVDRGDGSFRFDLAVGGPADTLCLQSAGGGVLELVPGGPAATGPELSLR